MIAARVQGLERTYGQGELATRALRGLSLEIDEGSFTAIVGPSGCGKSTLLAILAGLEAPCCGRVVVGDVDLTRASSRELMEYRRRHVAMVFQAYNLVPSLSAVENVEVGLEFMGLSSRVRRERSLDALAQLDLAHLARRFPAQLSGGEQQRVAVARALARAPRLLLADEPTGNLDREAGHTVYTAIAALVRGAGTTCVLVTHDEELAAQTDRVVHVRDGVVVPESAPRRPASSGVRLCGLEGARAATR